MSEDGCYTFCTVQAVLLLSDSSTILDFSTDVNLLFTLSVSLPKLSEKCMYATGPILEGFRPIGIILIKRGLAVTITSQAFGVKCHCKKNQT